MRPNSDHRRSLRLRISPSVGGSGRPVDCTIEATADTTVADVVALGASSGLWDAPITTWVARSARTGRGAAPHDPLAVLELRHGDLLDLEAAERTLAGSADRIAQPGDGEWELAAVAGPAIGRRAALLGEVLTIGRGTACGLQLDDASLSAEHLRVAPAGDRFTVTDLGSRNGTSIDGAGLPAGVPATVAPGAELEVGRSVLVIRPVEDGPTIAGPTVRGSVPVGRPPRLVPADLERLVEAPDIPERPRGPRLPVIAAVIPLIGGIAMWQLMHQLMFLLFTVLSPVMLVGTYFSDRLTGRSDYRKAVEKSRKARDELAAEVAQDVIRERATRIDRFPDAATLLRRARRVDHRLWERRTGHVDHLVLRIGLADQPSELTVMHPSGGDEALREEALAALPEHATLLNVPATVDLADAGVIGISGPPEQRDALVRWLVAQLATLQSPRDVQLAAVLDPAGAGDWEWLKWLPHTHDALNGQSLATTTLQVSQLLAGVMELQRERLSARRPDARRAAALGPELVVLVQDAGVHDRVAASELLTHAGDAGTPVIWTADAAHELPGECKVIVELGPDGPIATRTDTRDRAVLREVTVDGLATELAEDVAAALAPLRDVTQGDRGIGALPSIAHLAELEALDAPTPDAILRRWAHADGPATFTLGAGAEGPLVLDLVAHGPHALVGGTPGAGKSELLRGVLASLALRYPPSRMTFLLVDFKGGAAFREFAPLPHTVGIVTDLDEHLADRALTSFRAEIKYRESLLEQHGAIDVLDLERRAPDVVLPRLLIVIDEFATLAQEVPEFVDGVIDVTQRGRSLGVHLVLATQSPRGSVTGKIRANTNLAIALRTVSTDESIDILGTADAAAIPVQRKGRAWARIGDRDLLPFQSGYVGGNTFDAGAPELRIERFGIGPASGLTTTASPADRGRDALAADDLTDLERIATGVLGAFAEAGEGTPRAPWLPALPGHFAPPTVTEPGAFAIADEPERQRQSPVRFDPAQDGSLIVLGGPRSGKTTTLATVAAVLAQDATTDELHVYGLDCAGRALAAVEALPHCGSVIPGDDVERTTRLLSSLDRILQRRRDQASELGAPNFEALQERAGEPVPRVLVLVDDYGGFYERYERIEAGRMLDQLRTMVSDGPAFGVHFVLSADRRTAIPTSVSAAVPRRIVHRLADRDEYSRAGLSAKLADADVPPGRGFDEDGTELQVLTLRAEPSEPLGEALERFAAGLEGAGAAAPSAVRMLPAQVVDADAPAGLAPWSAFLGFVETDVAPGIVDLEHGNFVIAGPYRSGRSTALASLARSLAATTPGLELHLVAPRRSTATADGAAPWTSVVKSSENVEVVALFEALIDKADAGTPVLIAIDDANEVDPTGMSGLERLLRQARDLPLRVVIAGEAQALRTSYSPWHTQLRKDGMGLIMNPNLEMDGDLLGVRFPWRRQISFPLGRGMLVDGGQFDVLQVLGPPPTEV